MTARPPPLPPRRNYESTRPIPCRFYRPAVPPANIPASQASEYICFDRCLEIVEFPTIWFRSSVAPNFLVCATCFEQHIRSTPLAAYFTGQVEALGKDGTCMFGNPRVERTLWPPEKRSGSLDPIHAYMVERTKHPRCRGTAGLNGSQARAVGMTWYTFAQNAVPHFVACKACLEEHVIGTRLENMLIAHTQRQGDDDQWACDLKLPYFQRIIEAAHDSGDWSAMLSGMNHRFSVPACSSSSPFKATSRTFYRLRGWQHSCICESCYLDKAALTTIEKEFVPALVPLEERENLCTCDLASTPAGDVVSKAIARKDATLLHNFFRVIMTNPPCSPQGILGGKWYTLKGGCSNFDVCALCFTGLIETYYLGDEFQMRTDVRADQTRVCDLNADTPRGIRYLNKLIEAIVSPRFEIFTSFVRRTAHITPCQKNERLINATWWRLEGTRDFVVCEDCYESVIRNTACSNMFTMTGIDKGGVMCCLYSTNMRQRYQELCNANSPNARAAFIAYANHRQAVFAQTVPEMESLLAQAKVSLMQQETNHITSSFYQTMDMTGGPGSRVVYGPTGHYTTVYESSATGRRYGTPWGIESERYSAQAMGAMNQVQNDTMRVRMLEAEWRKVE